jgi:hypothetical protein
MNRENVYFEHANLAYNIQLQVYMPYLPLTTRKKKTRHDIRTDSRINMYLIIIPLLTRNTSFTESITDINKLCHI